MRLTGLGIGLVEGEGLGLFGVTPHTGLSVIALPEGAPAADEIAACLRRALTFADPEWHGLGAVTVRADADGIAYTLVDHQGGLRQVLMGPPGALPKVIELDPTATAPPTIDAMKESLQKRLAAAAGFAHPGHFAAALTKIDPTSVAQPAARPEEAAYVEAERKADTLAQAVRAIDDQMTRSVVPDWIWIATGAGGLGVLLTVVALFYPELRVILTLALVVSSIIGFGLYGYRAYGEQQTRGRLLDARAERKTERDRARASAKALAEALRAQGGDPEGARLRLDAIEVPATVPAIFGIAEPLPSTLAAYASCGRQVVVIADKVPPGLNSAWILAFHRESPSE